MPLNLKNPEVERLAAEVARITGETKTEVVRRALLERRQHLALQQGSSNRERRIRRYLESEVWPRVPKDQVGRRLTRAEEDEILGYGEHGA